MMTSLFAASLGSGATMALHVPPDNVSMRPDLSPLDSPTAAQNPAAGHETELMNMDVTLLGSGAWMAVHPDAKADLGGTSAPTPPIERTRVTTNATQGTR